MPTYAKILAAETQGRRQLWYICGSEPALVQDAYELAVDHACSVDVPISKAVFLGPEVSVQALSDELLRDFDEERMVVVLHEAEKFKQWDELIPVLKAIDKSRFFLAVSNAPAPTTKGSWASIFVNNTKARLVTCDKMSPVEKSTWVQSRLRITREAESLLIRKSWDDMGWLLNQMRKLEQLEVDSVTPRMVEVFCPGHGQPDFVEALRRAGTGKVPALASIRDREPTKEEVRDLQRDLSRLVLINTETNSVGLQMRQLSERTGLSPKQISAYRKSAVYYDLQAATRCFLALAKLQEGLTRGSRTACLALVSGW